MRPRSVHCLLCNRLKSQVHDYLGLLAPLADTERLRFRVAIASRVLSFGPFRELFSRTLGTRFDVPFRDAKQD
jgi:hypothetical protein